MKSLASINDEHLFQEQAQVTWYHLVSIVAQQGRRSQIE